MLKCAVHNAARTTSRAPKRTIVLQARFSSSSTPLRRESQSPSSSSPQVYLNEERKRKLVSLYHQAENFVTLEGLSDYIDREFWDHKLGYNGEDSRTTLTYELADRRARPKMTTLSSADHERDRGGRKFSHIEKQNKRNVQKQERVKAALYRVDESFYASVEMVEADKRGVSR